MIVSRAGGSLGWVKPKSLGDADNGLIDTGAAELRKLWGTDSPFERAADASSQKDAHDQKMTQALTWLGLLGGVGVLAFAVSRK